MPKTAQALSFSFLLLFTFFFVNAKGQSSPDSLFEKGKEAYKNSNIALALKNYKAAYEQFEKNNQPDAALKACFARLETEIASPAHYQYEPILTKLDSLMEDRKDPLLKARHSYLQFKVYTLQYKDDKAFKHFQDFLEHKDVVAQKRPELLCSAYITAVRYYKKTVQVGKAMEYAEKAQAFLEQNDVQDPEQHITFHNRYASVLRLNNKPQQAIELLREGLNILHQSYGVGHIRAVETHRLLVNCFFVTSANDSALKHTEKALSILKAHDAKSSLEAAKIYQIKGLIYLQQQKAYNALNYYQQVESIYSQKLPKGHSDFFVIYSSLAECQNYLNNAEKGLYYANKAINNIENQPESKRALTRRRHIYETMASLYFKADNLKEAQDHIRKAITLGDETLPPGHINFASTYSRYYKIALASGKLDSALWALEQTKQILKNYRGKHSPKVVMYGYANMARVLRKQGNLSESLSKCRQGFELVATGFKPESDLTNPTLEQIPEKEAAYYTGFQKIKTLFALYEENGEERYLDHAYETVMFVDSINQSLKDNVLLREEQSVWLQLADQFYPYSYKVFREKLSHAKDPSEKSRLIAHAYQFADKDKASMLSETLAEKQLVQSSNVPDSLFKRIQALNTSINRLKQQLRSTGESEKRSGLQSRHLAKVQAKKQLYQSLCKDYPKYCHQFKSPAITPLDQLQKELGRQDKNLVEYMGYGKDWFALLITPDTVQISPLSAGDSIDVRIRRFRSNLLERDPENHQTLAYKLYRQLFEPFEPQLSGNEVIIVPDGILGYLPFSALCKKPTSDTVPPYLLRGYTITYAPSASLWHYRKREEKEESQLAQRTGFYGFAPSFAESSQMDDNLMAQNADTLRSALGPIPHAKDEVKAVTDYFGGRAFVDRQATEAQFKKQAPEASIIHLATHGLLDDERPAFNKLLMARDSGSGEDGNLYTYELYNLNLNAGLTVLSACNTGYGKIREGEGVMNLARGFKVAGSANILMTLWSIDDNASAELMKKFYQYLGNGMSKGEALRKAKLTYIDQNDAVNAHPFYWAGFVMMGSHSDITPPQKGSTPYFYWAVGGASGLVIIGLGFWLWRRRSSGA